MRSVLLLIAYGLVRSKIDSYIYKMFKQIGSYMEWRHAGKVTAEAIKYFGIRFSSEIDNVVAHE